MAAEALSGHMPNSEIRSISAGTKYLNRCSDIGGMRTPHSTQGRPSGSNKSRGTSEACECRL